MNFESNIKPLASEIKVARDEAVKKGQSPDEAEATLVRKLKIANARLQEEMSNKALEETGAFFTEHLGKNKGSGGDSLHG